MPNPTVGSEVVGGVGARSEILCTDEGLIQIPANMARYDEHDWCEDASVPSAPGASAGIPEFPQGALLGFIPCRVVAWPHAFDADVATSAPDVPANRSVYTWTSGVLANRGNVGAATIPVSNDQNAVVLAHDVDIADYIAAANGYPTVDVIWSGVFVPRGIQQDSESYDIAPWPTVGGACDRLSIVPSYGHMVG